MTVDRYNQERELQQQFAAVLAKTQPDIEVLDVRLDLISGTVDLFVDRPDGGVDHEVCVRVTHAVRDTCPDDYALAVGSPGIDRPLRNPAAFEGAIGEEVKLKITTNKKVMKAFVAEVHPDHIIFNRAYNGEPFAVQFEEIVRCNIAAPDPKITASATEKVAAPNAGRPA